MRFRSFKRAVAGLALFGCVAATGCGTSSQSRSPLFPQVNVGEVFSEKTKKPLDDRSAEKFVNSQLGSSRGKSESSVMAPKERSWKDRLLAKNKSEPKSVDFGADPFLEDLDKVMAETAASAQAEIRQASASVDVAAQDFADLIPETKSAEPLVAKARDTMKSLAPRPRRSLADLDTSADITVEEMFGDMDMPQSRDAMQTPAAAADQAFGGIGEISSGDQFDKLFEEANENLTSAADTANEAADALRDFEVTAPDLNVPEVTGPAFGGGRLGAPSISAADFESPTANDFANSVPSIDPEPVVPEDSYVASLPEIPTDFGQDNASVTANAPATLPAASDFAYEPESSSVPAIAEPTMPASRERVEVDPFSDPAFQETAPEPLSIAPVEPDQSEPAPLFVQSGSVQGGEEFGSPIDAASAIPAMTASQSQQVPALDDIEWREPAPQPQEASLVPPGQWTAWFLIGGAIMVILLLFAPGRGRE